MGPTLVMSATAALTLALGVMFDSPSASNISQIHVEVVSLKTEGLHRAFVPLAACMSARRSVRGVYEDGVS